MRAYAGGAKELLSKGKMDYLETMQQNAALENRGEKNSTRLSPAELRKLADRMVALTDPAEVERLKKEMERGFYGDSENA